MPTIQTRVSDPVLLAPGAGESRWLGSHRIDFNLRGHQTAGALTLIETTIPAGHEPPIHVHERDDEVFYVLEGEVTFACGGRELRGGPGTIAFLPRGVPHGFRVESDELRLLVTMAPSGAEAFFHRVSRPAGEDATVDPARIETGLREVGITVVGPPPSAPGWGAHLTA